MSDNFIFTGKSVNPDGNDEVIIKHRDGREYKITGFIEEENIYKDGRYYGLGVGESATYEITVKGFCEYGAKSEVFGE